jgi:hypothetical protein
MKTGGMKESREWPLLKSRFWIFCSYLTLLAVLSACAAPQAIDRKEHGFAVKNIGKEAIRRVVIEYGAVKVSFCDPHCLPGRGGGGWNAPMAVAEYMNVTWLTSDGQSHSVRVPVKAVIKDWARLSTLSLQFNEANLIAQQWLDNGNPTILEFEKLPLYP